MQTQEFYILTTEGDEEGRTTRLIGYAAGEEKDIRAFYADRKSYNLQLEKATLVFVTPNSVEHKKNLLEERESIRRRLQTLDALLG